MDRDVTQGQPVEQAQPPAAGPGDRWYADHGEVVGFARVLVDAGTLDSPNDVIYFFEKPWKWEQEYEIWTSSGRPIEHTRAWEVFVELVDAYQEGRPPRVRLPEDL